MTRYEELRRIGMVGQKRAHNLGLALFIHRGMAVWMNAWADYCPAKKAARASKNVDIPAGAHNNMVMLLVSMIFSNKKEMAI